MAGMWVIVALIVCCGLGFLGRSRTGLSSAGWPSVDGRILSSVEHVTPDAAYAAIRYAYRVDVTKVTHYIGQVTRVTHYIGNRVSFDHVPAAVAVERYPTGAAVRVYYDPSEPSSSVLQPGMSLYELACNVLAALALFACAAWLAYKMSWNRTPGDSDTAARSAEPA